MTTKNEASRINGAKKVLVVLTDIESGMPADLSSTNLAALIEAAQGQLLEVKKAKDHVAAAVDAKNKSFAELKEFLKRVRSGAKTVYGDDSLEYERVGGKRRSEYKSRTKKKTDAPEKSVLS